MAAPFDTAANIRTKTMPEFRTISLFRTISPLSFLLHLLGFNHPASREAYRPGHHPASLRAAPQVVIVRCTEIMLLVSQPDSAVRIRRCLAILTTMRFFLPPRSVLCSGRLATVDAASIAMARSSGRTVQAIGP